MQTKYQNLTTFFDEVLSELPCQSDTRAYIISVFTKYKSPEFDLSKDSLTLKLSQALEKRDFNLFQNIGDWLFFTKSLFPAALKNASDNYYDNIAQISYHNCYKIIKSWKIYDELSSEYIPLTTKVKNIINKNIIISI